MPVLLTVNYRVTGDLAAFRSGATAAAAKIAEVAPLRWKIWGLAPDGAGVSAYLFETEDAARSFAEGPVITGLRTNPLVESVTLAIAPVEAELSRITRASFAT